VLKLSAGCAVEATGMIVPSPAKGQPFEMQANALKVIGWVEDPDTYPIQPKPHRWSTCARWHTCGRGQM
jgi:asparaginyl-tRNA synthetase